MTAIEIPTDEQLREWEEEVCAYAMPPLAHRSLALLRALRVVLRALEMSTAEFSATVGSLSVGVHFEFASEQLLAALAIHPNPAKYLARATAEIEEEAREGGKG